MLIPRFLPEVRPSVTHNYPLAIEGKRHGTRYRFFTPYRAAGPRSLGGEFNASFARLDYVGLDCFDLMWHRHTGEWFRGGERLSLAEALQRIQDEPYFYPS